MNQSQVSWLWFAWAFPFSRHLRYSFLKRNVLRPAFYFLCGITTLFPYVGIAFPLGVGIVSFQVKNHTLWDYCLKKSVKSHMPFQEEGKDLLSCFLFLMKMPSFHCLLQLHSLMESNCIYKPVAVELNYPVKLLPDIRRWWYGLWNQFLTAVPNCKALKFFPPGFWSEHGESSCNH